MRRNIGTRLLLILLLSASGVHAGADRGLRHAQRAQALLGSDRWSRIVRVENVDRRGPYPRVVYAVVFELVGILWFYTDTDGTQSFSLHPGQLDDEKSDFGPLLRAIDPGFVRWTILPDPSPADVAAGRSLSDDTGTDTREREGPLPNGCFIESLAKLRQLLAEGTKVRQPMLFSFYPERVTQGHTVLVYETRHALIVFDSRRPGSHVEFPLTGVVNALELARALSKAAVQRGRFLPLDRGYAPTSHLIPDDTGETRISTNTPRGQIPQQTG